jgi:hypothetical protein
MSSKSSMKARARERFDKARKELVEKMKLDVESIRGFHSNLNPETIESIGELIKVNSLGMLTVDSQQGLARKGKIPSDRVLYLGIWKKYANSNISEEEWKQKVLDPTDKEYVKSGGKFTKGLEYFEKAYLNGYIENSKAFDLINMLNQYDCVVAWKQTPDDPKYSEKCKRTYIPVTYDTINVDTEQRGYSQYNEFPLIAVTKQWSDSPPMSLQEPTADLPKYMDKYYTYIAIIDTRIGHHVREKDGLFKRAIECLEVLNSSNL